MGYYGEKENIKREKRKNCGGLDIEGKKNKMEIRRNREERRGGGKKREENMGEREEDKDRVVEVGRGG